MRVRVDDCELADAIRAVGDRYVGAVVFAPRTGISDWAHAEDELTEAFAATQEAVLTNAPVVFVVSACAVLGRSKPLDAAVATGLLGGVRALAYERRETDCYATVVAVGAGVEPRSVAAAIDLLLTTRGANGQIFPLGTEHLGAALP